MNMTLITHNNGPRKAVCEVCNSTGSRTWLAILQIFFLNSNYFLFLFTYLWTMLRPTCQQKIKVTLHHHCKQEVKSLKRKNFMSH